MTKIKLGSIGDFMFCEPCREFTLHDDVVCEVCGSDDCFVSLVDFIYEPETVIERDWFKYLSGASHDQKNELIRLFTYKILEMEGQDDRKNVKKERKMDKMSLFKVRLERLTKSTLSFSALGASKASVIEAVRETAENYNFPEVSVDYEIAVSGGLEIDSKATARKAVSAAMKYIQEHLGISGGGSADLLHKSAQILVGQFEEYIKGEIKFIAESDKTGR